MGYDMGGPETSHEERHKRRLHVLYTRQTHEKQIFMRELIDHRKKRDREMLKSIKDSVGPRWYQALSVPQREALDALESAIYQDVLEGRPRLTSAVMRSLGLFPYPSNSNLMQCCYVSTQDPKQLLAQLYYLSYGYPIEGKRASYNLNARLMLSGIFYLGLGGLIELLRERFRPDVTNEEPPPKPKVKPEPPLASPYLQKMVAVPWLKPEYKRPPPPPLPNLDDLDDPYEDMAPIIQKPPPRPPPPPVKKRIPRAVCDALAGFNPIVPHKPSATSLPQRKPIKSAHRKTRSSKSSFDNKKMVGCGAGPKKTVYRKPVAPSTGMSNSQFTINGVFEINGKPVYVLGNVSVLPAQGDLIHGGYVFVKNAFINLHCGYRGRAPPPLPFPCDCLKKWQDSVMKYVKSTKCYCGHNYDFGNEGTFPPDELPYFMKPTRHSPLAFNYPAIYDIDEKHVHVEKEFKKIWETDSFLHIDDGTTIVKKDNKKKKKRSSKTCLGANPQPEDYLKCALRFMRRQNLAACLPDLHLVPELKEWMRRRLYGPLNPQDRAELLRKSTTHWRFFTSLAEKGYGHVSPPKEAPFYSHVTWLSKKKLNDRFRRYSQEYKLAMYRSHAYVSNLLWRTMNQAELPDKSFRQIYFSYLFSRMQDLHIIQPYNSKDAIERRNVMARKRYICLPAGADMIEA